MLCVGLPLPTLLLVKKKKIKKTYGFITGAERYFTW